MLALDADDAAVQAFERAAGALGVPLTVVQNTRAGGREAYEARMVLVRPDQYVAWVGDAASDDVEGVLRRVTGRR